MLERHEPLAVAPLYLEEDAGLGTYTRLKGAQLFIPAEFGLTAEWLRLQMQTELERSDGRAPDVRCEPPLSGVQVSVQSAGNGFWVQFQARNDRSAKPLLSWARAVVFDRPQAVVSRR
jgi:hypothetical protein